MYSTECKLLTTTYTTNSIGVQTESTIETTIPIIKVEDIYSNEFYQAQAQGFRPELRLRVSTLNYNGEKELEYMGKIYSIIRTQTPVIDETVLICERKLKNGKD